MSEEQNNSTMVSGENLVKAKRQRVSKVPVLLALLALSSTLYLGYQGMYGEFGVRQQMANNAIVQHQIMLLTRQNQELKAELQNLANSQQNLHQQIQHATPNQGVIVVNQLNNLIGAANQSLILYHDIPSALKLLNYALQIVSVHNEPQYADIKISLTKDIESIQAINSFDNTVIATKLEDAYQLSLKLNIVSGAETTAPNRNVSSKHDSIWDNFIANFKKTFLGIVKVESSKTADSNLSPDQSALLYQHLQLDILNARQAFVSKNQGLWQQSLKDAIEVSGKYFVNDQNLIQELQILRELQAINLDNAKANLDLTMQSLVKLQQFIPISSIAESAN
ncbi:uroporphyrinogen-III C-methyltransferase [Aquella oligotrophica]|uniref:Uroporphyrinogen-III C-methyltransferase n=1 Tax=Aquella oligotrophica TaxID=2067065 RepID=A0A2I7N870_9NEIS|nr:uroporphyrinogen-III C-methyltransferase [Aquella oligotrophica]AUR52425.1 hypothetical protein CUN60_08990 [Aquella oligotrophica]